MSSESSFSTIDEEKFNSFHWRMIFTTGMGVFCDGYDLTSIAIVLPMVLTSFGISQIGGLQSALLAASALVGSALGALIFGILGQFGRKRFYGLDLLLMGVMAAAQAFSPDLDWLIAFRFILGIGIGADYVLSPTITVEHANRADRGRMIGLGFAVMWTLGSIATATLNFLLAHAGVTENWQWRIVLAAGAVPALATLYLRRTMPETARYLSRLAAEPNAALKVMREISSQEPSQQPPLTAPSTDTRPFAQVLTKHAHSILSATLLWMIFDMVVYPGDLFGPSLIAKSLGMTPIGFSLFTHIIFSVPSLLFYSFFALDQLGRKKLQTMGFIGAAIFLTCFGLLKQFLPVAPLMALISYGLFTVALNGATIVSGTGILGVELTPTRIRTFGQAITVIGGRIGASVSGFLFPLIFTQFGEVSAIFVLVLLSMLGAWFTHTLIPETGGRSLEFINQEDMSFDAAPYPIMPPLLPIAESNEPSPLHVIAELE